jgi:uncharacterized membrane protein (DUF373 family)
VIEVDMDNRSQLHLILSRYFKIFEKLIFALLLILMAIMIVYALGIAAVQLYDDLRWQASYVDSTVLKDTFNLIFTVVILMEFSHSLYIAISGGTIASQVRTIILIGILVVIRKLMLFDLSSSTVTSVLVFCGIPLALGILYWILGDADRRISDKDGRDLG